MPDIEVEAQSGEARFVHKGAQIRGRAHLAGGVLDSVVYADVTRVQDQMLQGTKSRVALALIGGLARPAHVEDHSREWKFLGDVDGAFQIVHGLDAADALDFADGERLAAFAGGAEIAAGWRGQRRQRPLMVAQRHRHFPHFNLRGVVEVAARAENLDALKSRSGDLAQHIARQLARDEQISGQESLHTRVTSSFYGAVPRTLRAFWPVQCSGAAPLCGWRSPEQVFERTIWLPNFSPEVREPSPALH